MVGEHLTRRARREFESTMASNLLLKVITMIMVVACSSSESLMLVDPFGKENDDATILGNFREVLEKDPQNSLGKWKDAAATPSPCKWTGVTCSHDNRVTALDLSSFSLQCNFSTIYMLFGLQKLQTLVVSSNGIHGNITTGYLGGGYRPTCSDSLTTVDLSDNNLQGPLSSLVLGGCKNLVMLNISKNELTSPEKKRDFNIKTLKILDISNNKIALLDSVVSTNLDVLLVANNKLARFNPMSLLGRGSLQSLDLSGNNMSGRVSGFVYCPSLEILDLSSNALEGELDSSLNNCKQLKTLNLSMNQLNGTIPNSLGVGLRNIERILMSTNHFSGSIPYELGLNACKTLLELDLSVNLLSGTIPSSFSSCNSLYSINLSNNQLSGLFPVNLIASLTSLKNLLLSYNNITGSLPNSLSIFPNLENLDLSSNKIKGTISQSFCKPSNLPLQKLYLQNNLLSGNVPSGLAECNQLRSLDLSFNFLTGSIPPSLGSLQYLQDLVMWLNRLEGEIPVELTRIHTLENLILDNNLLTGTIPVGFRNCTNLMWISLSSNRLSGTIPTWIGELDKLAILQLGNNTLSGTIPKELGNCKSLIWLDLNSNELEGGIPAELSLVSGKIHAGAVSGKLYAFLRNEAGSSCRGAGGLVEFAGIRPEEINRIPVLHSCKYTRVYRGTTMYQFKDNGTMIFIDFSYNNLAGNIPDGIGSMYYLQVLNLGHNNLTGAIPSSLGSLKQLGLLDLSYNKLAGRIPSELSGLSFMSDLDFSNNNLSGEIPIGGQLSTFPPIRYENNTGLCGVPLPACSPDSPSGSGLDSRSKHKNPSLAGSVAMGLLVALLCIFGLIVLIIETRRRKKQDEVRDIYMDSLPTSGNGSWKFAGTLEPLSINVATFEKPLRKLTFAHLLEATNGFNADSLIGSGGFGDVYKAQLKDGTVVAIKKLIHISGQGDREFMAEMETIGKIKHRNLVPLLGYCKVGEERLLVYEYMTYGSLENVLHNQQKGGIKLDWLTRKKIAIGAARGLAFLHHSCIPHIIHRDMKSSNVLIDENLEARVSDFGMARLMNAMDTHLSVSTLAGTPGYVPPEYYQSFRCTTKGDVYSYGVVLLELLTGRKPTDSVDFGDNNLVGWVKQQAKMKISDIFDPELMKDQALEMELLQHLKIACECLDDRPWRRPTMIQVLAMFRDLQKDGVDTELDSFSLVDANVDETADPEV